MNTQIGFIPLDSRPCNYDWVFALGKMAHVDLYSIEKSKLASLHKKLDFAEIEAFVMEKFQNWDYLLIPIDALISGGLIQSRSANFTDEEIRERLGLLRKIKSLKPELKILAFDTVLRTSISTFDEKTRNYWKLINEFSKYKGRFLLFHEQADEIQFKKIEAGLPPLVLKTYLLARENKHKANLASLSLLKDKVLDFLLLLQEDSMPYGLQTLEHRILEDYIRINHLEDRAWLYNGTDEGTCLLLAKALQSAQKKKMLYYLLVPDRSLLDQVLPFEDRNFSENLAKMSRVLQMSETNDLQAADFVLGIYVNEDAQKMEIADREQTMVFTKNAYSHHFIKDINRLLKEGYPTFLLDISAPNGGCYDFLKKIGFLSLKGFSGWNTASNSTGSLLAQAYVYCADQNKTESARHFRFLAERVIDDCFYQDVVRGRIHEYLRMHSINTFYFPDHPEVEILLNKWLHELSDPYFSLAYKVSFPWKRSFEIKIEFLNH
ncbi:MAG TPA: hypothetical protein DD618_03210 [Acholeplasmatales bacterium]|nr:hypothetical protein [Acholeplasmatales bacterium]